MNPMTYLLQGLRALSMEGWDAGDIGVALLAVAVLGMFSLTLAFMALRGRVR
jgi:ABC-2 type transport system permease protein